MVLLLELHSHGSRRRRHTWLGRVRACPLIRRLGPAARQCDEAFDGRRWTCFRSGKVCAITYARIQGKQAMIQRFQNSSLLAESLEVQPRLFVSQGPDKGKPERFPGGAELPVELPPPVVPEPPARRARNRRAR